MSELITLENNMNYRYGTMEYLIDDTLKQISRMDKQYNLLARLMTNKSSIMPLFHVARLARMLASNAREIDNDLYPKEHPTTTELYINTSPRLIKH